MRKDVPRDYKNALDDSDNIFFEAFSNDVKLLSEMINLRKRMMGIVDSDTSKGIETDFKNKLLSDDKLDDQIINQIEYLVSIVNKKGGQVYQNDLIDLLLSAKTILDARN